MTEVADAANVSRRTAYRYFPTGEQLIVEALLEGMRSDVESEIDAADSAADMAARVDRLVDALHHLTVDKEHLLRQMILERPRRTRTPTHAPSATTRNRTSSRGEFG